MRYLLVPALALSLLLVGCQPASTDAPAETAGVADTPAAVAPAPHAFSPAITGADFLSHVTTLASDEFGGRGPGTKGETLTTDYLRERFQAMGYQPGNDGQWLQAVPMTETTASPATATIALGDKTLEWHYGSDWIVGTRTGEARVEVNDSPIVFVGYGVNAPEENWNDYEGLDVRGKTVVMLVNDPGFHVDDPELFEGKRMTYYGRWTYKYEEAARQGAAAAIIIHDTPGAGYGWDVVANSWGGAEYDLPAASDPEPRLPLQGWISAEAAQDLFAQSGLSAEAMRLAASERGFKPVPLPGTFSATLDSAVRDAESNNVLALLPGTERPDEVVIYMAHWDHLGTQTDADGNVEIYNGAIDNASGVAGILEIAGAFAAAEPPQRSVLFVAVTLEESGLLGSAYYAANPTFPLKNIAAVINIDAMTIIGRTRDMVVTGYGSSELEDILRPIAERQGRVVHGERDTSKGYYFRSDHFSFAKVGVPALYAGSGLDHVEKGEEYGIKLAREYGANRYHKPGDVVDPDWDLEGVVQDLEALYGVGRELADGDAWPNWYPGNAFKAARDAQRAGE